MKALAIGRRCAPLRHPISALIAVFSVALCSILALPHMPIDIFPNLNLPVIYVFVSRAAKCTVHQSSGAFSEGSVLQYSTNGMPKKSEIFPDRR